MRFIVASFAAFAALPAAAQVPQAAQPAVDYSIATPAVGRWTYARTATGSAASFLDASSRAQLILTCVRSVRHISIARPATGAAPFLMLWTSSERRNVPASFNPATGLISANLTAFDKLFDALAFSRGRIAVGPSNAPAFVAPAEPEYIRVIEDCRS